MTVSSSFTVLALAVGWSITLFVFILEIFILYFIWIGTNKKGWTWDDKNKVWNKRGINLENLISDEKGDASLSRFQFLIFTFVIAMSLFYLIITFEPRPAKFPEISTGILGLLGISGGSYILAKGIQASRDINLEKNTSIPSASNGVNLPATSDSEISVSSNSSQVP
jgi:hypothetical protein